MKKIKGFTMLEILIISVLITTGLFSVRQAVDHARKSNESVKQNIIANQLATEWAELIYQKRNTNFLEFYYNTNYWQNLHYMNRCRLAYDFNKCASQRTNCDWGSDLFSCTNADKYIMKQWYYYISTWWGIINCSCETNYGPSQKNQCAEIKNNIYAICLNSWVRVPCPQWHDAWNDESKYGKFYRMIEWIWIYDMSVNQEWWEPINSDFCSQGNAQEYRFCSRVARDWGWGNIWWWEVEICSTMTNFARIWVQ